MFDIRVPEPIPPRPWYIEAYGVSLASVRDANGNVVIDKLNYIVADFIVAKVNGDHE